MEFIAYVVLLPIGAGIVLFLFPEKIKIVKGIAAFIICCLALYYSYILFQSPTQSIAANPPVFLKNAAVSGLFSFNFDNLSKTVVLFIGFFGAMISLYSLSYITRGKGIRNYYSNFLVTIGASAGAVLSDNFLLFITFWGVLGLTLYKLIKSHDEDSSAAAKKSFILIGASDSIMIFGIGLLWILTKSFTISGIQVATDTTLGVIAFIALLIGALTKAGAFPLHSWVPDYTETAPASSSALIPASLDKLLGIYLLARICTSLFILNPWLNLTLLIIGVITIITAVMMALMQHSYKRLLGFHAVSQVGYMVTGFGLGTAIGVAGGLFHMLNNALYKSGLFLVAGSVEKRTGEEDLENIGGLSRVMPITFITALIFALSISGVPPFNGFASKWIIYQGIIEFGAGSGPANKVWVLWLILAIFGSALTLASFIKFISGAFLGKLKPVEGEEDLKEVSVLMWLPQCIIAVFCLAFGIFATRTVVPRLIVPMAGDFKYAGVWSSNIVTGLILLSLAIGFIIYLLGNIKKVRTTGIYAGGEDVEKTTDFSAVEFYKTIQGIKIFSFFYKNAEQKIFDLYDNSKRLVLGINKFFSRCHSGELPLYAVWVFLGMIIIAAVLIL
jgi:NADH:ubiquinone oxidoreductase subunit 5 (subunit L)/multisubunit Na+/H+ antiporter MnhA subunit